MIRLCTSGERPLMLRIINDAAERYRGVIPEDRWRTPYMPADELDREIAAGVAFWGALDDSGLVGVMGVQPVQDVTLIRHAYVSPASQSRGVGADLLRHLRTVTTGRMLVGTWAAAAWAVRFYERHGFTPAAPADVAPLLRRYWRVPDRQIDTSVVLVSDGAMNDAGDTAPRHR